MASDFTDEGFEPVPPEAEPPEGAVELSLQEEAAGSAAIVPSAPPPPVIGRTWALDFDARRLAAPAGGQPVALYGEAAMRQAVVKALTTDRGAAAVHSDEYGRELAERDAEGQPFESAAFAELEAGIRDALLALPWVLAVEEFDATGSLADDHAEVSFRVVPDGDDSQPLDFTNLPLPIT